MPCQNLVTFQIKSNDIMCHLNWHYIDKLKYATCHLGLWDRDKPSN